MTVTIDSERKAVNICWDKDAVPSDRVDVHTRNPATGDTSQRTDLPNDGEAVLTYPSNFTGTSQVVVVPAGAVWEGGDITPGEGDSGDVEL
jgi:hypothetical protein